MILIKSLSCNFSGLYNVDVRNNEVYIRLRDSSEDMRAKFRLGDEPYPAGVNLSKVPQSERAKAKNNLRQRRYKMKQSFASVA